VPLLQPWRDLRGLDAVLLTRAVLHEADQVSQEHDDGHFADGGDVDGGALLDVGVEVL
jgi:hypothetical protein